MTLTIRQVTPDDFDAVCAIESACFPKAEAATSKAFKERIAAFPESFLVAECDSAVIGFINGGVTDEPVLADILYEDIAQHNPNGAYQTVFGLDVLPDYQHQGIARQLMYSLIAAAKDAGRKGMLLTCKDRLIGFYEQFGYVHLGVSASVHGGAVWNDMQLIFDPTT